MPIKIKVDLTEEYMYDFMKYHNNSHMTGIIARIMGYVAVAFMVYDIVVMQFGDAVLWFAVAAVLLAYLPLTLRTKAKQQVKKSPMFNKSLEIVFMNEGVLVRQDGQENLNAWENFTKAVSTRKSVLLYVGRVRAFIFPKACMGEQYEAILEMLRKHLPEKVMKIRH